MERGQTRREVDGIDVLVLDVAYSQSMSFFRRKLAFAEFAVRAALAARTVRADIVLATSTPLTIAFPGVVTARRRAVPLVLEIRDLWPTLPIAMGALRNPVSRTVARLVERWAYRSAQHIVALSPGIAEGIISTGVPESKVSVIPNSSDIDLFGGSRRKGNPRGNPSASGTPRSSCCTQVPLERRIALNISCTWRRRRVERAQHCGSCSSARVPNSTRW